MVSRLAKDFMCFLYSALSTIPLCPGNIVVWGDLERGIIVLLTSHEVGSPTRNIVECVLNLITTLEKISKWELQMRWWRLQTRVTPVRAFALTGCHWTLTPCNGILEAVNSLRVSEETLLGQVNPGIMQLELWLSENIQSASHPGLDGWRFPGADNQDDKGT